MPERVAPDNYPGEEEKCEIHHSHPLAIGDLIE